MTLDLLAPMDEPSKPIGGAAGSNAQTEAFANPRAFLSTLQSHFAEISQGKSAITLNDLQLEAVNGSDNTVRTAAALAAQHFNDLAGIERHVVFGSTEDGS